MIGRDGSMVRLGVGEKRAEGRGRCRGDGKTKTRGGRRGERRAVELIAEVSEVSTKIRVVKAEGRAEVRAIRDLR